MIVNQNNFNITHFDQSPIIGGPFGRKQHLQQAMESTLIEGCVMEFGVARGETIKYISSHWPDQAVWGFDSFQGLPEPWFMNSRDYYTRPARGFDLLQEGLPTYPDNVKLVIGWYDQSISPWLESNPELVKFLHVDCVLYSSTITVLTLLKDRIVPGTVIVFDDFYPWDDYRSYALWKDGEYRALKEWTVQYDRQFKPLFHSNKWQCSIIIVK